MYNLLKLIYVYFQQDTSSQKLWKLLRDGEIEKVEQLHSQKLLNLEEKNDAGKTLLMVK